MIPGFLALRFHSRMLLLVIAVSAANFARTAVGPLQETIRQALSLSDNQMALLQGPALAVPIVLAAIPLGFMIDRHSRVRLIFVLSALNVLGTLFTAFAPGFPLLFLARCLVGLTASAVFTTALSLVADFYAPHQRGRATMVVAISQIGGMAAAFGLGGALLASSNASGAWRSDLVWLAVPLLLATASVLAMREPARTGRSLEPVSNFAAYADLWRYRGVIAPLLFGMVMAEMALGAILIWAAPTLSRGFGISPGRVGAIMAVGLIVSGVIGPTLGGTVADLCQRSGGPRRTLTAVRGLTLLSIPCSLFGFATNLLSACVLLILSMTLVSASCVMGTTLFTVAIPSELRGLCLAVMAAACITFAVGLAPITVSLLSGAMGGAAMVGKALSLVGVVTNLLASAAFVVARRGQVVAKP